MSLEHAQAYEWVRLNLHRLMRHRWGAEVARALSLVLD
jgi:hypothetical protein